MGLTIGISGAGQFASSFIPLFQVHPAIDEVCIAEVFPERRAKMAELFRIRRAFASHEELLRSDVDAVVILTQRWTHADLAVQAGITLAETSYSCAPGILAHESARRGGEQLPIPDFGWPDD